MLQQYAIPAATIDFHLKPNRGNIYVWVAITGTPQQVPVTHYTVYGLLAFFPGGPWDVSTMNCIAGKLLRFAPLPF
jgi:hypothetical protein